MAGGVVLAWRTPGRRMAVLFALLVAPGVGSAPSIAPTVDRAVVGEPPAWAQLAESIPPPIRAFRPVSLQDRPSLEDAIATLMGGSGWRWGIAAARSEDPARPRAHDQTWLAAASEGGALLDRYGIALAILPSTVASGRKLTVLGRRGSRALVLLPVAPAASVMQGWRWAVDPGDALALLFPAGGGTGMMRGMTVLAGGGPLGPSSREPRPCAIRAWRDGDIDLSCTADTAGYAVVSSTPAAGWTVSLDDRGADWLTADVLRRAVAIPTGAHRVHWTYTVPGLRAGALVGLVGALLLIALWGFGRRRRTTAASGERAN